jgi:hypothetical protein
VPKLRDLEATFLKVKLGGSSYGWSFEQIGDRLVGSDGIKFLCPKCFAANGGRVGTHMVICWWVGVDPSIDPKPGRWTPIGTSLDDVTFVPGSGRSQSVALLSGCMWHGFVQSGSAE